AVTERSTSDAGVRGALPKSDRLGVDPPLAGRKAELATVRELLDHSCGRRGHVVSIVGEAGMGKTRLVSEIAALARARDARPILLVLTTRDEHLTGATLLDVALQELRDHARLVTVPLAALSRTETTALARSLARAERDPDALARLDEHVWRISSGNPLLVLETVRALRDAPAGRDAGASVPTRVREIVMARLERLSEPARRVVSIASLIGRECDFRLLQHCAGLSDRAAAEVVEELVRRRVFHGVGERLYFTHDRLREVASHALVPAQTTTLHRMIATSMETVYAGDLERHYAALAAHCRDGELWDHAVIYLTEAATRAAERSAHREAAAC